MYIAAKTNRNILEKKGRCLFMEKQKRKVTSIKKDLNPPAPVEKVKGEVITADRVTAMSDAFDNIDKKVDNARFAIMQIINYSETNEIYKDAGYKNNADFVNEYFGYGKEQTSKFRSIMNSDLLTEEIPEKESLPKFGKDFDRIIKENRKGLRRVKSDYKDFTTSKLYILSRLAIVTVKNTCNPSMSLRELESLLTAQNNKDKQLEDKKKKEKEINETGEQISENAEKETGDTAKDMNNPKTYKLWHLTGICSDDDNSIKIMSDYLKTKDFKKLCTGLKEGEEIALVRLSEVKE